mgnify:CR=1 FL=1
MKKFFALILAVTTLAGCTQKSATGVKAPIRVRTEVASPVSAENGNSFVGIVEEREATAVSFTGMGVVRRVLVSEGQSVSRGQLLAEMDNTQALSLLSAAQAQMTQADDALERYTMLHDAGSLPEVQWVEIQSKVAQARSQLAIAKKNVADCRLVAPVSGVVGRKLVSAGETALPSQAVVTILDVSRLKVKVSVPEAEVAGRPLQVTLSGGWGVTTKNPTLNYFYPNPYYTNFIELSYYDTQRPSEDSRFVVVTTLQDPTNYDIRPARNHKENEDEKHKRNPRNGPAHAVRGPSRIGLPGRPRSQPHHGAQRNLRQRARPARRHQGVDP